MTDYLLLRDIKKNKDVLTDENIIAIRFDGSLYFANVSYFEDAILKAVSDHPNAKYILVIGDGINQIDASGEEVIHHLVERLSENDITVVLSGLKLQILDVLRATELIDIIGKENVFRGDDIAIDALYDRLESEQRLESRPLSATH